MVTHKVISIVIVDDHEVVRLGLRTFLSEFDQFEIVGECGSSQDVVNLLTHTPANMLILDIRLPDGDGFAVCRTVRARFPETKVVFLTAFSDDQILLNAISAGAHGFLLKDIPNKSLIGALMDVAKGGSTLSPSLTGQLFKSVRELGNSTASQHGSIPMQERRVLEKVAEGMTNKQIGEALGLSEKTVKNYLSNVMDRLGLSRRAEAAAYWVRHLE